MKTIYSVSPMICDESLLRQGTTEHVVLNHFYLFKTYHESRGMIELYVKFINYWFDNVFEKLNLKVVEYEFPDYIMTSSGEMEMYIIEVYKEELRLESELCVESYRNFLLGNMDILLNGPAIYDSITLCGVLDCNLIENDDELVAIMYLSKYLKNQKMIHEIIKRILCRIRQFRIAATALGNGCFESYDSKYIDEKYFTLYQLFTFVEKKRREEEYELCNTSILSTFQK